MNFTLHYLSRRCSFGLILEYDVREKVIRKGKMSIFGAVFFINIIISVTTESLRFHWLVSLSKAEKWTRQEEDAISVVTDCEEGGTVSGEKKEKE